MKYAPVLIATVNRYQHFKDCLESLSRCVWANKTDVFVAVDYPPEEKYWHGYNQIKEYLSNCDGLEFLSLNVIYRETNYFFSGKDNLGSLLKEVFKKYDRAIVTEDDNIFSPNFLLFMNKGLEKYKDDCSVLAINGYRHFYPVLFSGNTFFRQNVNFSAWGFGIWLDKYDQYINKISPEYFREKLSIRNFLRVLKNSGNSHAIQFLKESQATMATKSDWTIGILMALENMDVVMPRISMVRNMGWDNSGLHCKISTSNDYLASIHMNQTISSDSDFDYIGTGKEYYSENRKIFKKSSYEQVSILHLIFNVVKFLFKSLFVCIKLKLNS